MNEREHDYGTCEFCKGALDNRQDHYALGRLRLRLADEAGLTRERAYETSISELAAAARVAADLRTARSEQ